jgi:protease-4
MEGLNFEDMMMRIRCFVFLILLILILSGCAPPNIRLYPSSEDPLREFTLQGKDDDKLLVIPIRGIISDAPKEQFFRTKPSMVQELVSQLRRAEKDPKIKAVLLKIDSPGGSVIASDILYTETAAFKKRTGAKIIVIMMGIAASGGYYISLPADYIMAHPGTVTGSIGVVFFRPQVYGLMGKIGLGMEVNKSGRNKDMGSPFRKSTAEEEKILQRLTDQLAGQFLDKVALHRKLDSNTVSEISTARIYLADEALDLGLIDKIGHINDAIAEAKKLAGLSENHRVIVFRRIEYPDDNLYNTSTTRHEGSGSSLISLGLPGSLTGLQTGFYYLWAPAVAGE